MQALRQENEQLRISVESMLEEIQNQKEINAQHQTQIQTLLQFNERLLAIIQNQANNQESPSLQPISQRSERESDLLPSALNSLIKSKKMAVRSQRGTDNQYMMMDRMQRTTGRLNDFIKEKGVLRSEQNKGYQKEAWQQHKLQYNTTSPATSPINKQQLCKSSRGQELSKTIESSKSLSEQMSKQIQWLKKYRKESASFYNDKIDQLKNLSAKINSYQPIEQLNSITAKLTLSKRTAQLISQTIHSNRK